MGSIDDQIRERLNRLRNEHLRPSSSSGRSLDVVQQPIGSGVERVERLLERLTAETEIDEKATRERFEVDSEIRRRLDRLKEESRAFTSVSSRSQSTPIQAKQTDDSGTVERTGEEPLPVSTLKNLDSDEEPDSCCMCDSRATLICKDCFGDLYCDRCWTENHDPDEKHVAKRYMQR